METHGEKPRIDGIVEELFTLPSINANRLKHSNVGPRPRSPPQEHGARG